MSLTLWLGFLLAAILIAVTPGPGAVLSMSTSLRYGYRSALVAILGLQAAILVHLLIVAIGFGALLAASETAFTIVKFIGAAYLIWLGVQKWRSAPQEVDENRPQGTMNKLFAEGLLVNLTNPKAIVFFLAFMPQFIRPAEPLLPQYFILTATVVVIDIIVMWFIFAAGAKQLKHLTASEHGQLVLNRVFGILFIVVGILLALV